MTYSTFDADTVGEFRNEFENDIKALGKKYGLNFKVGRITYQASELRFKMEVTVPGFSEAVKDVQLDYQMKLFGLITKDSDEYTLIGYNSRSYKFPFRVKSKSNGKIYKFSGIFARKFFGG